MYLENLNVPAFHAEGRFTPPRPYLLTVETGERKEILSLDTVLSWPIVQRNARLASVSGFSVRAVWEGVDFAFLMHFLGDPPDPYVYFESHSGYGSSLRREDLAPGRALLCTGVAGEPLPEAYGGPLRLLVPHLWGYKSVKWLGRISFRREDVRGFWEKRGEDPRGEIPAGTTLDLNSGLRREHGSGEIREF